MRQRKKSKFTGSKSRHKKKKRKGTHSTSENRSENGAGQGLSDSGTWLNSFLWDSGSEESSSDDISSPVGNGEAGRARPSAHLANGIKHDIFSSDTEGSEPVFTIGEAARASIKAASRPHPETKETKKGVGTESVKHKREYSIKLQAKRARRLIRGEFYDWTSDLADQPFNQSPEAIFAIKDVVVELERFVTFGLCLCLDVILFCFSFLPLQVVIAAVHVFRSLVFPCKKLVIYPKHIYALIQGLVIASTVFLLSFLDLDLTDNYERIGRALNFTRLHTLFLVFEATDALLNAFNQRVSGSLVWCVTHKKHRIAMTIITILAVLVHSSVMNMQVSTLHKAINGGEEMLGLLLAVKLTATDLKAGLQFSKLKSSTAFNTELVNDVVNRFRWITFLSMIMYFKVSSQCCLEPLLDVKTFSMFFVAFFADMLVLWTKHIFFSLVDDTIRPSTYEHHRSKYSESFLRAPKLGLGDASHSELTQSFNFVALPMSCVLLREFWNGIIRMQVSFWYTVVLFLAIFLFKIFIRLVLRAVAKRESSERTRVITRSNSISLLSLVQQGLSPSPFVPSTEKPISGSVSDVVPEEAEEDMNSPKNGSLEEQNVDLVELFPT